MRHYYDSLLSYRLYEGDIGGAPERTEVAILIGLLFLCIYFLLLTFNVYDDNRLTSWQWVFTGSKVWWVAALIPPIMALAWIGSGVHICSKYKATILFCAAFLTGVLFWGVPEANIDTARYFSQAKYLATHGIVGYFMQWGLANPAWTDLPLIPAMYGIAFALFGESRWVIQCVTTLCFSGTLVITYFLGKAIWGEDIGFKAGLLLLGMPYLLSQIPLMLVDIPTMFILLTAVYVSWMALSRNSWLLLMFASVMISASLLSKYSTWLMLSVLPVIGYIQWRKGHDVIVNSIAISLMTLILLGPFLAWKNDVVSNQINLLLNYQIPILENWEERFISSLAFQINPLIGALAIISSLFAIVKKDLSYLVISWMILLIIVIGVNRLRYSLLAFPMLSLMAAYALSHIKDNRLTQYLVLGVVGTGILVATIGFGGFLKSTSSANLQQAGHYLNSQPGEFVEVVVLPQTGSSVNPAISIPILDLYTHKQLYYANEIQLNNTIDPARIKVSPVRFSWEYSPGEYRMREDSSVYKYVVVVASSAEQDLPQATADKLRGFRLLEEFLHDENVFKFTTIVRIYKSLT